MILAEHVLLWHAADPEWGPYVAARLDPAALPNDDWRRLFAAVAAAGGDVALLGAAVRASRWQTHHWWTAAELPAAARDIDVRALVESYNAGEAWTLPAEPLAQSFPALDALRRAVFADPRPQPLLLASAWELTALECERAGDGDGARTARNEAVRAAGRVGEQQPGAGQPNAPRPLTIGRAA